MSWLSDNFISRFFMVVINLFAAMTGNYIVSIVVFTFVIKIVLLPLDIKQRNSTKKMQMLQGKVKQVQERYKHDQQLMAIKLRELYKKENVSPSAGCLPALLQMPIMFAMFGAVRMLSNVQILEYVSELMKDPAAALPSTLWVRNIWQPDTGTANVMPALAQFSTLFSQSGERLSSGVYEQISMLLSNSSINQLAITAAKMQEGSFFYSAVNGTLSGIDPSVVKAAASMNYNAVVGPLLAQYEGLANGYFVFPVMAGAAMFLSTWLPQHMQKKSGKEVDKSADPASNMQGFMLYIMPLMIIWISTTTAVPFSIYYIASSAFTIFQFFFLRALDKRKSKGQENQVVKA